MRVFILGIIVFLTGFLFSGARQDSSVQDVTEQKIDSLPVEPVKAAPFTYLKTAWADSTIKKMSLNEKIGQLFMVAAWSNRDTAHTNEILRLIEQHHIGGLIFFQGGPVRQAQLTNLYQSKSKIPLMIGIDGEWGLTMRLDSTQKYPKQMTLGAVQNDTLIEEMGTQIARECKRLGIHVNFAPVVDINNNANNPVINARAFGENLELVTKKSLAYMRGMQKEKILACAKHFPGHGDTDADSHKTMPTISASRKRLDSLELKPFKKLIQNGVAAVMVAHLHVPALDPTDSLPVTLSKPVVTDLLKKEMGFTGLTFTDALNMQGVSNYFVPGEIEVKAIHAGNDVLLYSENIPLAIEKIKQALADGTLTERQINESVHKILMAKKWTGADKFRKIQTQNLFEDLNPVKGKLIQQRLTEKALTLLKNEKSLIPLKELDTLKIVAVSFGDTNQTSFQQSLNRYAPMRFYHSGNLKPENTDTLKGNLFIVGLHYNTLSASNNYGIDTTDLKTLKLLRAKGKVILTLFGNPYAMSFAGVDGHALVVAYENSSIAQDMSGQLIFGGIGCSGTLPVSVSGIHRQGDGIKLNKVVRFKYTIPEDLGINSEKLNRIDSIANYGIKEGAYPGCVVLAAKNGKVFYYKSFGHHSYDEARKVDKYDIYDLASVTKISASITSLMKLTDQKKFNLDDKLGKYLPEVLDSSVYSKTVIRHMVAHQAGFVDWIPFWMKVVKNGKYDPKVFRTKAEPGFTKRVAENLYMLDTYEDSIFKAIKKTPLRGSYGYKYSDLGYYLLKRVVYKLSGLPLDKFAAENFYKPLGLQTMGYNPRERFDLERIPPTEDDNLFRKQLVHGDVHDQGAAMVGGVGGHAGLFANANDVGVLFQMLMNYGTYGGERYINEATIKEWTKQQFSNNRRGAGFDRPTMSGRGPTCNCVSEKSFGHTGFTGITAWADPVSGIVYVFLSNRSHPVAENPKIINLGLRTRIQQVIVDAAR